MLNSVSVIKLKSIYFIFKIHNFNLQLKTKTNSYLIKLIFRKMLSLKMIGYLLVIIFQILQKLIILEIVIKANNSISLQKRQLGIDPIINLS